MKSTKELLAVHSPEKISTFGLTDIYKVLRTDLFLKKEIFSSVKLIFSNSMLAENFKHAYDCMTSIKDILPFRLKYDTDRSFWIECVMNSQIYFDSMKAPEKQGELLLIELEKYVDISNVPQVLLTYEEAKVEQVISDRSQFNRINHKVSS